MRIILDTDKKTITVSHNYQQKLNDMNKLIAEYSGGAMKPKRSASSVSKYVQMKGVPTNIRIAVENLSQKG